MSLPKKEHKPLDINLLLVVEPTSKEQRTTHQAACHCGAVAFSVTLKWPFPKYPVNTCTCSICFQNGYLLVYPCRRDVVFSQGEHNLGSYRFNSTKSNHQFCKTCGSSLLIDFERPDQGEKDPARDIMAVNVRHFQDIDLDALEYTFFDGRKLL